MCQAVGRDALGLAREMMAGKGQASGELNALQRIAAAASEPLLALGRSAGAVIFSSLGSTTAVAVTSSLGILRLGFGVFHPRAALFTAGALIRHPQCHSVVMQLSHKTPPVMCAELVSHMLLGHGIAHSAKCASWSSWGMHCRERMQNLAICGAGAAYMVMQGNVCMQELYKRACSSRCSARCSTTCLQQKPTPCCMRCGCCRSQIARNSRRPPRSPMHCVESSSVHSRWSPDCHSLAQHPPLPSDSRAEEQLSGVGKYRTVLLEAEPSVSIELFCIVFDGRSLR